MSGLFIRRPVMTLLVMMALLVFGTMAYRRLPVSDLPNVDFPTLLVTASLPGASAETMASAVATPLERQFSTIAGIDSMSSVSALGTTQVTLQFALSRNLDAAAQDVQAAIAAAARLLPPEMPSPPTYQKVNPADMPILYLGLTSPSLPLSQLDEYGETLMAERISMVSGVAQVQIYGPQKYAVRVQIDPHALDSRGIGLDQVADAVASANVNLPTGTLNGPQQAFTLEANGQLTVAAQYQPIVVSYQNGSPVRISELGRAIDSVEDDKTAAWTNGQRGIVLAIQRQPGTNTIEVAQAISALLPSLQAQLPASVGVLELYNRADMIRSSVSDVKATLLATLVLVILVIFVFLRNVRATIIPAVALPLSLVGTFGVMYAAGYSLDNLSLLGLTLSVGFVVDDAIVMLENIVRHMEMGKPRMQAALDGAREIGFTIVSMTLSLAAVFIPILFLGGILGRLFHEFAVTIGAAIIISGLVSLTLTPMLSSRILKAEHGTEARHGKLYDLSERGFEALLRGYARGLGWALDHRRSVLVFSGAVLALTVVLFIRIPKGFLPSEDRDEIFAATEAAEGISFPAMVAHQQQLAAIIAADPDVQSYMSSVGSRGASGINNGIIFAHLIPRSQRKLSADEIIQRLRPKLARVPGIRAYLQNPPPIRIGGVLTKSQYQYTLRGGDTAELYRIAGQMTARMRALPGLQDVTSDLQMKNPQVTIDIDRDQAATYGVTAAQIETVLYDAFAERQISTIYAPSNTYEVILELLPQYQQDPNQLDLLYVRSSSGKLVPLRAVAHIKRTVGPLTIAHSGQLPSVTVSFNLRPDTSLGEAVAEVSQLAHSLVPATMNTTFEGTAQAFQSSLSGLGGLLVLAILVIYLVLGVLYESFIHPLTILTALPFAGFGALCTLFVFHEELSVYAFVGVIMLVGLVKKNGIMMIDFALEAERLEGLSPRDAIYRACKVRFRPIMMTTMAALMGTLPIALGWGAGAESRRPLGLAVVGGLVFSQFLTLFVTPVFFVVMDRLRGRSHPASEPMTPMPEAL